MGVNVGNWARMVHETYVGKPTQFTADEAEHRLGKPSGNRSAEQQLELATSKGWFKRHTRIESRGGRKVTVAVFVAVDRFAERGRNDSGSYFTGIKRCRSIFELGNVL